jgi:hypothetical protein
MGDNRRIQVISAGYSKTEFIERLDAIFPDKNYKLYVSLKNHIILVNVLNYQQWRLDHWEIVADRPLKEVIMSGNFPILNPDNI